MNTSSPHKKNTIFTFLRPYAGMIILLIVLTIVGNGLNLILPKIIAHAIDSFVQNTSDIRTLAIQFSVISVLIFIFIWLQNIVQVYVSERAARDLRSQLTAKISTQDFNYIRTVSPAKLLTNLTSDVDAVKTFISLAIPSLISSVFIIIGASVLLFMINWKLALAVIGIIPIIGFSFQFILKRVRKLFTSAQESIDWLNRIINESILGSFLIRILNSQTHEYQKFIEANARSRDISLQILKLFATLIPIITLTSNLAILVILMYGWSLVIGWTMTLGDFSAFNAYIAILIFPIIIIGFVSNVIAQAWASYNRILGITQLPQRDFSDRAAHLVDGEITFQNVSLKYWEKDSLRDISFTLKPHSKTAIIGPTAAGKTQLLYIMAGLLEPTSWTVSYDGKNLEEYDMETLRSQIGIVFQESNIFNLTLRENIAFSSTVNDASLEKAIATAELTDFINLLPDKLDTIISERWTSLSWWQKQRILLARALSLNPKILILDDFTARLDTLTEKKILENVHTHYPDITLISVTQKIEPVKDYDQIILLMEWEILKTGTHAELLASSPEYNQIYDSQLSTNTYE